VLTLSLSKSLRKLPGQGSGACDSSSNLSPVEGSLVRLPRISGFDATIEVFSFFTTAHLISDINPTLYHVTSVSLRWPSGKAL
jgi:hypothetical protein